MKRSLKENLIRIVILLVGLTIAHFGVTLFILTNLGADPFNVLVQGVYRTLIEITGGAFLTHGRTHMVLSFLIIVILLFTDRGYIKIGTFLCMICGGPIIDVFTVMLSSLQIGAFPLGGKIVILALGCAILAYGMTIVIQSDAGTGPNDLVALVISDKGHKKFSVIRMVTDATFVLIGFLLDGTIGIGTVICVFVVGPVAGVFLPVNKKLVEQFVPSKSA